MTARAVELIRFQPTTLAPSSLPQLVLREVATTAGARLVVLW
ncbi:hypothetical protein [Planobispora longispora]